MKFYDVTIDGYYLGEHAASNPTEALEKAWTKYQEELRGPHEDRPLPPLRTKREGVCVRRVNTFRPGEE